ncbi:MAG: ferrous iron transporter B, partial [Ruminococcaceae bacterium]|nr:ferrous iron transporter B [Oscillospiraceae bacterium]
GGVGLQLATGYIVAFLVYQVGTLITEGTVGSGFVPGLIAVLAMVGYIAYLMANSDKKLKAEYALGGKK